MFAREAHGGIGRIHSALLKARVRRNAFLFTIDYMDSQFATNHLTVARDETRLPLGR